MRLCCYEAFGGLGLRRERQTRGWRYDETRDEHVILCIFSARIVYKYLREHLRWGWAISLANTSASASAWPMGRTGRDGREENGMGIIGRGM